MSIAKAGGVAIVGVGHHLPSRVESNEELCHGLAIAPEWIVEKTGIYSFFIMFTIYLC
jgi:3-oxoacyl-[acyl-carrier-protein] synthase III